MNHMPLVSHLEGLDGREALSRFVDTQNGLLLCLSGSASFRIGVKLCEVHKGDILVLALFSNVALTHLSDDFQATLCVVNLERIFAGATPLKLFSNIQFLMMHPVSHPSLEDFLAMASILDLIEKRNRYYAARPFSDLTSDYLVNALAFLVLDSYLYVRQTVIRSSHAKESIMLAFHEALMRDYATHRTTAYYAALQKLSPRYFSTSIKAVSGYTPMFWINTVVVSQAKRMMRDSNISIKEVAYNLNFKSPTFFSRWFREFTGETPSEYRTRYRIAIANATEGWE